MPLLPLIAIFCLLASGALAAPAPQLLRVSPTTGVTVTQTQGQPVAVSFTYGLTASRGNLSFTVRVPAWLKATPASGKTVTTIAVSVVGSMPVGVHEGVITFTASTGAVVTRPAKLTVTAVVTPQPPPTGGGACLDNVGVKLTDGAGVVLTCP